MIEDTYRRITTSFTKDMSEGLLIYTITGLTQNWGGMLIFCGRGVLLGCFSRNPDSSYGRVEMEQFPMNCVSPTIISVRFCNQPVTYLKFTFFNPPKCSAFASSYPFCYFTNWNIRGVESQSHFQRTRETLCKHPTYPSKQFSSIKQT